MPPKRRRRFQGLYYHSSPPKVLPMNGQSSNQGRKQRNIDDFSIKLSTIRIWMHEKDIGKLTRILWAGQGSRLCQQASTNPRVKRFLAAVPYVMNSIKDVHQAVIDNNLETLQAKMEPPVPPALITCRDANGLNLIHKAAGLGHTKILEYLIGIWPDGVAETDVTGKTPLHWAASHKNNMRCYTLLTETGCDDEALDYKMKSPTYYRHKPHEIERAFLVYVPEAPRVSPDVATDWEALSEDIGDGGKKLDIKIPDTNGFHGRTTDDSIENTSEVDLNDGISTTEEEQHAATITNGNGDDSAPQTPAKDDEETANDGEEAGEAGKEETPLTNGETVADDVNGYDEAEAEAGTEDTEAAEAEGESDVEANGEVNAQTDAEAVVRAQVGAEAEANPEVDATEAETNIKALNDTTTTTTNGSAEHAEQRESEAATTVVNDGEDVAKSEIVDDETKDETMEQPEKVEEGKEESESKTNEEHESNLNRGAEQINEDTENQLEDQKERKTTDNKVVENTDDDTKENEVEEDEIKDEAINTESKIEETKVSVLSIEPRIESGDTQMEEHKEQKPICEPGQEQTQAETKSGDKEESKVDELQHVAEKVEDHKNDSDINELEHNIKDVVEEPATADTIEAVKEIVKEVTENVETKKEDLEKLNKADEENENKEETFKGENKESGTENEVNEKEILDNENGNENTISKSIVEEDNSNDKAEEIQKNKKAEKDEAKEAQEHVLLKAEEKENAKESTERVEESDKEIEAEAIAAGGTNDCPVILDEKTELSEEKEKHKSVNESEALIPASNESKIEKDEENKDTIKDDNTKSAQLAATMNESPDASIELRDGEKSKQEAPNVNDKTEEDKKNVSDETNQAVAELKEKTTTENGVTENVMPQNDGTKLIPEQQSKEIDENKSKEQLETIDEHAISNSEQVGGKIPRLTTAKLSRGKRNGSAKRNGSGKKKTDTLIEGEHESDGEYDEDDEDEQKHESEKQEREAATDSENESHNGYESDNEPTPDSASEHDDEVQVVTDAQTADTAGQLDENHNEDKHGNGDVASSPTSSLAIEGFVTGASEDNRVLSQSAAYVHEVLTLSIQESDIRDAIDSGDMEQLAQIVLNGDGAKLVNMHSHNPDIQAFLSNVPSYMNKIRRVHEAAREGSLLALQQALDRRKFAIAKDDISPNGATPLHVAVLFGSTDIVRYLAARFSETTTITDNDGRTALHYAATINDNGHFYNVLTQLGANSKALDKLGHTPEFYQNKDEAKDILNYKKLLSNFGAEELEDELLNDQGQAENVSSQMNPIFKTEQGKYLANNLADPLIKALTEIANKRPEDPVAFLANYLQNYVHQRDPTETSDSGKTNSTATITSHTGMVRRTGMGLHSASNLNGDADRIEEDHISNVDEEEETQANIDDRDEHGQSMLHFACARSHRRGALMHLIEESNIDITYRDELYRTARDVSLQANQPSNAKDIDRYVLSLAVIGDVKPFEILAVEGYDHIVDITDDNELSILDIAVERGHEELANFLRNLRTLEELREELHQMIRDGNVGRAKEIVAGPNGKWLLKAKNYYGRTALHIAVLKENEEVVEHFVNIYSEALKIGDNLERTVLHYAMGTNAIESLSRILIQKGAKRTTKDLKGRQPSYYFMNKADILRLQEEEEENR